MVQRFDYLVIGSGIAGMSFALKVANEGKSVALICKAGQEEANTYFAQGGIASVTNLKVDNFEKHIEDTMIAGDWISDRAAVEKVVREAPAQIEALIVYLFGKIGEGDLLAMLLYTAVIAVLCALTFVVLSRSFIKIATSSGSVKKVVYKEKKEKRKTPFMAILQKEFGRFLSSPNYMLNCGLGVIALPIVGVVMLFKGNDILDFMNMIFGSEREGMLIVLVVTALSLLASMNDMVVPSVSLEGKNIWIAQSLPMDLWQVLRAKLSVQLLLTIVPLIVCEICFVFVMPSHGIETILGMIVPIVFAIFLTLFGLFLGLQMPNLSWTNELAPIKQSLSVVISMFGGWVVSIVLSVLYYTTAYPMGVSLYFAVILVAFAIASVVLCIWLKKKGTIIFANLSA